MTEGGGAGSSRAVDYSWLVRRFRRDDAVAVALAGSRARGDAGEFSDVDLWVFCRQDGPEQGQTGSYLIDGLLVTVSDVTPSAVAEWFESPVACVAAIQAVRDARILDDPESYFAAIQRRAHAFAWDETMRRRAHAWVSAQMAGWVEEVYKGIEGLRRGDTGRLLNARFGLSWGLNRTVQVYLGIFLVSDNSFYDQVAAAVGRDALWTALRDAAFAVRRADGAPVTLAEQVMAGLELYVETAHLVRSAMLPEHQPLVAHAVDVILHERAAWAASGARAALPTSQKNADLW